MWYGYLRARTAGGSQTTLSLLRTVSGTGLYLAQIVGSILLLLGDVLAAAGERMRTSPPAGALTG